MKDVKFVKEIQKFKIPYTPEIARFVLNAQHIYDNVQHIYNNDIKLIENEYEKLKELHFKRCGMLPYSHLSKDAKFLNCLRLDYKEYRDGFINFFQLLKCLLCHALEIRENKKRLKG